MPEREKSDFERKALEAANKIIADLYRTARRRSSYRYYEAPDQRMFCYTPWKDENGYYYTWVLKPVGKGARSGKAKRWRRVGKVVLSRTRKTADKRARTRYQNWLKYLAQEWRNE